VHEAVALDALEEGVAHTRSRDGLIGDLGYGVLALRAHVPSATMLAVLIRAASTSAF
jgi:hypothetical protein